MASTMRNPSKYGTHPLHMEWIAPPLNGLTPLTLGGSIRPPKWSRLAWDVWTLFFSPRIPQQSVTLHAWNARVARTEGVVRGGAETLAIMAVLGLGVPDVSPVESLTPSLREAFVGLGDG